MVYIDHGFPIKTIIFRSYVELPGGCQQCSDVIIQSWRDGTRCDICGGQWFAEEALGWFNWMIHIRDRLDMHTHTHICNYKFLCA